MTQLDLPVALGKAVQPLFDALPIEQAMHPLLVTEPGPAALVPIVEKALADPALAGKAELASALWLYVDQLDRSHYISQGIDSPTGSFWHAIMHRREGDFSNSKYWLRQTGDHPAMAAMRLPDGSDYHGPRFVDQVQAATQSGRSDAPDLITAQQHEWSTLFQWCSGIDDG